jgi:hypothetical protein
MFPFGSKESKASGNKQGLQADKHWNELFSHMSSTTSLGTPEKKNRIEILLCYKE